MCVIIICIEKSPGLLRGFLFDALTCDQLVVAGYAGRPAAPLQVNTMAVNAGAGIDGIIHQICPMVVGHIDWTASPRKRMKRCRAAKMAVAARYVGDPSYAVLAVAFKAGINTVIKGFNLVPRKNPVFWMLPGITRERVAV